MASAPSTPTEKQLEAFAAVSHYWEALGEPVPASHVARRIGVTRQRVMEMFAALNDLGWLKSAGTPAIPTRPLPPLRKTQVPEAAPDGDPPSMAKPTDVRTVEMPALVLRAEVAADKIDDSARTAEVIFSTGAAVERFDWVGGTRFVETLSLDPGHVRLGRLNNSAPLLDSHSAYGVRNVLGVVEPGSAQLVSGRATAVVRFSKRAEVDPIWQDVRDGILRNVSVGYRVHKYERTLGENGKPEKRHAVDWEPFEISAVPMGADDGAKVRGDKPEHMNPCEIVEVRAAEEKTSMAKHIDEPSEFVAERVPAVAERQVPAEVPAEPNERDAGIAVERERCEGILTACASGHLPQSFSRKLIADNVPLVEAQRRVLAEIAKRDGSDTASREQGPRIEVGDDPLVHVRAGIEAAILHRAYPRPSDDSTIGFALPEVGRPYRGMSLRDVARTYLNGRGIRTTGMSPMELASVALGLSMRGGMHSTSDFALLLADVTNKVLRQAYGEAPQTFLPIARRVTLPDFKLSKRMQIGEAPALLEIQEHGEFTSGTIGEGKEEFRLKTYGRKFAITRTALVNDDMDAFSRVPIAFGRAARNLESDLAWAQITANGPMSDGVALFHANHGNLAGSGGAISVDTIGAARAAMRVQKALDAATLLNINPIHLIVPAAKETIADQFVSVNLAAAQASNVNPFAGRLRVICEPRLDAASGGTTAWYLAADPSQIDIIEYALLEGETGPVVESRVGFDVDGLEVKARHDFAAKVIDHRGLYKNPGA